MHCDSATSLSAGSIQCSWYYDTHRRNRPHDATQMRILLSSSHASVRGSLLTTTGCWQPIHDMLAGALCEAPMHRSKRYCAEVEPRAESGRLHLAGHPLTDACALDSMAQPALHRHTPPDNVCFECTDRLSAFALYQYARLQDMVLCQRDCVKGAHHPCALGSAGHAAGHSSSRSAW
jgi:hypothetical protein